MLRLTLTIGALALSYCCRICRSRQVKVPNSFTFKIEFQFRLCLDSHITSKEFYVSILSLDCWPLLLRGLYKDGKVAQWNMKWLHNAKCSRILVLRKLGIQKQFGIAVCSNVLSCMEMEIINIRSMSSKLDSEYRRMGKWKVIEIIFPLDFN